eukprot:CAMPEP_0172670476 /NCGR_PEP_ID=MMETSP1074-20121228/10327_1 /TAXON_ID=2916 /ORGANISM="Ceratium fusus, Strain PA161109" /LENGTH=436 /DNA_ID=CAMNT_0013487401 /DNA_START=33 /DNA_END=1343 /DNA_ORIENTATION=+
MAREHGRSKDTSIVVQGILCVLCTLIGAFYPTLLDWSKTTEERSTFLVDGELQTEARRTYPFSPISVVLVNDFIQLSIALCFVAKKDGLNQLFANRNLVLTVLPLGAIYGIGELLTLRSVQKGSGPVYVVIANMKLVIAALMSRAFFGRVVAMPYMRWVELVLISLAAAGYTVAEAQEAGSVGARWNWEGAWMALAKSSLVAVTSVFCESTYKNNKFHSVLCLQALWGFVTISCLIGVSFAGLITSSFAHELRDGHGAVSLLGSGPNLPLCASSIHAACLEQLSAPGTTAIVCQCVNKRGWDAYTLLTILADLSNAVSSALIFKKLSAVAKYVCRATSAVPMYLFYCLAGRKAWNFKSFLIVVYLCVQVSNYTVQRHRETSTTGNAKAADFVQHYTASGRGGAVDASTVESIEEATAEEGFRQRNTTTPGERGGMH